MIPRPDSATIRKTVLQNSGQAVTTVCNVKVGTMFICPTCKKKLSRQKGKDGVFWFCHSCSGRTASLGLLRNIVSNDTANTLWRRAKKATHRGTRDCPACEKKMFEVPVPAEAGVEQIDVCTSCQFVWFDAFELRNLPKEKHGQHYTPKKELSPELRREVGMMNAQLIGERSSQEAGPDAAWQFIPGALGLPVEHTSSDVQKEPLVTWVLAIAVTVFSVAAFFALDEVVQTLGLIPVKWTRYGGLTLLTSFFLHGGFFHLIGNVYFLLVFGDNVEDFIGHCKFLALVLIATTVGDIAHIAFEPNASVPCIGASGGISGIITFYALRFPGTKLGMFIWFRWVRLPALAMLIFWIVAQIGMMFCQLEGSSGVSALAHLGGAVVGLVFWLLYRKK